MITKLLKVLLVVGLITTLNAADEKKKKKGSILKGDGISIAYRDNNDEKTKTIIKRITDPKCKKVRGMDPNIVWGGDYAKSDVPDSCKKTFITTIGKISSIKIAEGIETYGELEVIEFMKKAQSNENMLLIDARMTPWYEKITIPTSVNLPFKKFNPKNDDFELVMDTAGVEYDEGIYDFTNAKTLLLFCNGAWCPQSGWAIENLIKIGYPKEKLLWYRGGLYSWTSLNLTTIVPQ